MTTKLYKSRISSPKSESSFMDKKKLEGWYDLWSVMEFPPNRLYNTSTVFCGVLSKNQNELKKIVLSMRGQSNERYGPTIVVTDVQSILTPSDKFFRVTRMWEKNCHVMQELEWLEFLTEKSNLPSEEFRVQNYLQSRFRLDHNLPFREWKNLRLTRENYMAYNSEPPAIYLQTI